MTDKNDTDLLHKIETQRDVHEKTRVKVEKELKQLRADKLRSAKLELAKAVLDAWSNGVTNVSALARALNTKDRRTVHALLDLAREVTPDVDTSSAHDVLPEWRDILKGFAVSDSLWRVRTTQPVPLARWAYPSTYPNAFLPEDGWTGELDFIHDGRGALPVPTPLNPLYFEWRAGTYEVIEFVKKVVTES